MPQVAFIVKLDIPEGADKAGIAEDIQDALLHDGYSVLAVNAWSAPDEQVIEAGGGLLGAAPLSNLTLKGLGALGGGQ